MYQIKEQISVPHNAREKNTAEVLYLLQSLFKHPREVAAQLCEKPAEAVCSRNLRNGSSRKPRTCGSSNRQSRIRLGISIKRL